ncbi:hypothetical protein [Ornithinibacillus contaminans]|uniref:hypothetical protein n=1 Tax=Ornithinibacillus contaminans TaxID=694055 RepID=UPI00064E0C08|nr:hypothetical protein [Ornithinibacillus contaminans]
MLFLGIILSIIAVLFLFAFIYDYFTKKKNVRFKPDEAQKFETTSQRIYKEAHNNQVRENINNHNSIGPFS